MTPCPVWTGQGVTIWAILHFGDNFAKSIKILGALMPNQGDGKGWSKIIDFHQFPLIPTFCTPPPRWSLF
jgi:hypothetical protein